MHLYFTQCLFLYIFSSQASILLLPGPELAGEVAISLEHSAVFAGYAVIFSE